MKTKRVFAGVLSTALCLSLLTACGNAENGTSTASTSSDTNTTSEISTASEIKDTNTSETEQSTTGEKKTHTLYIRDDAKSAEMTATFWNSSSDKTEDIKMEKAEETDKYILYSCEGDTNTYNMVHLSYGESQPTMDVAFNEMVSGWYLYQDELLPYTKGKEPNYSPKYETKTFKFDGYDKNVYIWTPDDYDKDSTDKYSVIYMMDGQSVLSKEIAGEIQNWNVAEHVESMTAATGNKAIIVAIETAGATTEDGKVIATRDDELIPDIGEFAEWDGQPLTSKKRCGAFSDFIYDTIVPYIEENYNVYTDAAHNAVAGSSFGGLASFYIGMDHPDKFGTIGAFSASFQIYKPETLEDYAKKVIALENKPFVYFYAGGYTTDTAVGDVEIYNDLIEIGYPKDKLVFNKDEDGEHFVPYWRNVYPEFLEAMFTGKVSALESGAEIAYENAETIDMSNTEPVSIDPDDPRTADIMNYFYFDNSETKWDKVYAWWWGDKPVNKITGEEWYGVKGPWPGVEMEKIGDTDIYRVVVPLGDFGLVFSSGVTDEEIENGTIGYQTKDLTFNSNYNAGQIYTIDTSVEPKPGRGIEKTKYKYSAGEWSNYTGE